jgi:thiosulfate dehydrogenase
MNRNNLNEVERAVIFLSRTTALIAIFLVLLVGIFVGILEDGNFSFLKSTPAVVGNVPNPAPAELSSTQVASEAAVTPEIPEDKSWFAPDEASIPSGKEGDQIKYGKELIAHTAKFLGPKGSVGHISNGMNCQNCHNEGGTKPFAFNFAAVKSTYPQFKARSNSIVSIAGRINGCFERSLNGTKLDTTSKEMLAMVAYMKWLGKDVAKGVKPKNAGIMKLAFLDRAADPLKGKAVFVKNCVSCHGKNGEGLMAPSENEYTYPALWGKNSYNDGAGLYRISNFAGFVKNNMPFGVNYQHPILSDEESWDVAAFVNSQPRPHKDQSKDWKNISKKNFDFPFGPYTDQFSEQQHKYGPFKPIANAKNFKRDSLVLHKIDS